MPVVIDLDARLSSDLNWKLPRIAALKAIGAGEKILWNLDFGLFQQLQKPLNDPGQFSSFCLALDHFQDTIWNEFHKFSLGAALFRGDADYHSLFSWDDEQEKNFIEWSKERSLKNEEEEGFILSLFARDVCADYLEGLACRMPDNITPYVIFEQLPDEILLKALLTNPERYGRIVISSDSFSWNTESEKEVGVYMPALFQTDPSLLKPYRQIFNLLEGQDYKLIPEERLITSWTGLNTLYYVQKAISPSGLRKIAGFLAAGGEVHKIIG